MAHINLPAGAIILWSGAIVDVPAGFVLCDGNNGTPDLRDRFLVGAGDTYAVDAQGGSTTHTHTGTTDGHEHFLPSGVGARTGPHWSALTTTEIDTFTTDPGNNLPPYYALAYIMKT